MSKPKIVQILDQPAPPGTLFPEERELPMDDVLAWISPHGAHMLAEDGVGVRALTDRINRNNYRQGVQVDQDSQVSLVDVNGVLVFNDIDDGGNRGYEMPQWIFRPRDAITIMALAKIPPQGTLGTDSALISITGAGGNAQYLLNIEARDVSGTATLRQIGRRELISESSAAVSLATEFESWLIIEAIFDYVGGEISLRLIDRDGNEVSGSADLDDATSGPSGLPAGALPVFWGRRRHSNQAVFGTANISGTNWRSQAADCVVFDGIISGEDRAAWLGYLQSKQATLTQ